jgi:hypothetical protein
MLWLAIQSGSANVSLARVSAQQRRTLTAERKISTSAQQRALFARFERNANRRLNPI